MLEFFLIKGTHMLAGAVGLVLVHLKGRNVCWAGHTGCFTGAVLQFCPTDVLKKCYAGL